jgi:predicted Zn-dependent protease
MNKILFPLILTILVVVTVSGCVTDQKNNQTNKYSQNGVSFDYPQNWRVVNVTSSNAVAAVADPTTVQNGRPTTAVIIQKPPLTTGANLQLAYERNYANFFNQTGYQKVSEANITSNNTKIYENVYTINTAGLEKQYRVAWLSKKRKIYVILCSALKEDFNREQSNFNLVINSFQAQ